MNRSGVAMEVCESIDGEESISSSSRSGSSTTTSSTSTTNDEEQQSQFDAIEMAKITDEVLRLPRGLCENKAIFSEFFSWETWCLLSDELQTQLHQYLPRFTQLLEPEQANLELQRTAEMLFGGDLTRFGMEPLSSLQHQLEAGNFRPDVLQLRQSIAKSKRREQRFTTCERLSQLAKQMFLSREELLRVAFKSAPDSIIRPDEVRRHRQQAAALYTDTKLSAIRAQKRFYMEMEQISQNLGIGPLSADEEDDCNDAFSTFDINKLQQNSMTDCNSVIKNTMPTEKLIYGTSFKRRHEMNDEDSLRIEQNAKQPRLSNRNFRQYLLTHKRKKHTNPNLPDFDINDIRLREVFARAQMSGSFKQAFGIDKIPARKLKSKTNEPPALVPIQISSKTLDSNSKKLLYQKAIVTDDNEAYNTIIDDSGEVELQQEEVETYGTCEENIPAFLISNDNTPTKSNAVAQRMPKLEPIANKQTIETIIPSNRSLPSILSPLKKSLAVTIAQSPLVANPELIQETHACFFSLIRDFFCATTNHRMKYEDLKQKIDVWLCNPITALNDWYSQADCWSTLLTSAVSFLAGDFADQPDEYVPFIEYKKQLNIYQWIGAGRDSDARLSTLCNYWTHHRHEMMSTQKFTNVTKQSSLIRHCSTEAEEASNYENCLAPPLPPPRFPTVWSVRAATFDEIVEFQRQERERFENPQRAYTFRMYGYESVVGPVRGIYTQILALSKARGHSMMIVDRPNFVTILTLVRDATARLPNGEGTRADISELLKCSQYINREASENVLQSIVSGALDRMHTEFDPCVRYDPKRKMWIYLHRNRTEAEFEQMHQQQQGVDRPKKPYNRKSKTKTGTLNKDCVEMEAVAAGVLANSSRSVVPNNSMPALVPANSVGISNNSVVHQPQPNALLKYPPVPPLKYNIPQQHQQKSLLKSTLRQSPEGKSPSIEDENVQHQLLTYPKTQVRTFSIAKNDKINNTHSISTLPKQLNFATSQAKVGTTPIVVSTSSGFQMLQVPNANSSNSSAIPVNRLAGKTATTINATLGGKKVSLHKPIVINQVMNQTMQPAKTKISQITKQQTQSFVLPISVSNEHQQQLKKTIFVGNSQLIGSNVKGSTQTQAQLKNMIRIVPAQNNNNNVMPANALGAMQQQSGNKSIQQQPQQSQQQQVKILGQRVIAKTAVRPQVQQQQQTQPSSKSNVGGISIFSNVAASGTTFVKMTPQAFASLQQKQGQNIIVKQQQQRVVVGNTAIVAQPSQATKRNVVVHHLPITGATQKPIVAISQDIQKGNTTLKTSNSPVSGKIQTINANNLTPQQQRVLLQNLRQQHQQQQQQQPQQQIQFKTVQVVSNSVQKQQQLAGSQTATILPQSQSLTRVIKTGAQQQQQQHHQLPQTTVASNIATVAQGTRVLSNSTGQIISLENLLQKQGSSVRIAASSSGKSVQTKNIIHLASNNSSGAPVNVGAQQGVTQYTVVAQSPHNPVSLGTPQRLITSAIKETPKVVNPGTASRIVASSGMQHKTPVAVSAASTVSGGGGIRVISAGTPNQSFNMSNLQGKQLVFATKTGVVTSGATTNLKNIGQAQQIQNSGVIIGGQSVKLHGNANIIQQLSKGGVLTTQQKQQQPNVSTQMQTVIVGNQIMRVQQLPQAIKTAQQRLTVVSAASSTGNVATNTNRIVTTSAGQIIVNNTANLSKTFVLGTSGQAIRFPLPITSNKQSLLTDMNKNATTHQQQHQNAAKGTTPPNRVVLVQGGGQIFLSPNFQGGPINLKSLQNLKVSMSQNQTSSPKVTVSATPPALVSQKLVQKQQQTTILKSTGGSVR